MVHLDIEQKYNAKRWFQHSSNILDGCQYFHKYISFVFSGCDPGWRLLENSCFRLFTDYKRVIESKDSEDQNEPPPGGMPYVEAEVLCANAAGSLGQVGAEVMSKLTTYFKIWRHNMFMGDIWLGRNGNLCRVIQVGS